MKTLIKMSVLALAISTGAQAQTDATFYDISFLSLMDKFSNWQELEQDPKTGLIYDEKGNYYKFVYSDTGNDCKASYLSSSKANSNTLPQDKDCTLKVVKGELEFYKKGESKNKIIQGDERSNPFKSDPTEKSLLLTPKVIKPRIEPVSEHFFAEAPRFYSPTWHTSEHSQKYVMTLTGAHVIDLALTSLYHNMKMYRPFTVTYQVDGSPNLPRGKTLFIKSGCVLGLNVGANSYGGVTFVSIKPLQDTISRDLIWRAWGQYYQKNAPAPNHCYHANNIIKEI